MMVASVRMSEGCGFTIALPVGRLKETDGSAILDGVILLAVEIESVAIERDDVSDLVADDKADDLVADDDCEDRRSSMALHISSIVFRVDWTITPEQEVFEHSCEVDRKVPQAHAP